jgi:hypothetical protein
MDRYRRTHCMVSTLAGFESSRLLRVCLPRNPRVRSSYWQRRGTSPSQCGCFPDVFERMQRPMTRRFEAWIEFHEGHFGCNSQIKCFRKLDVDFFFLFLVCGTRTRSLSAPFSYTVYKSVWLEIRRETFLRFLQEVHKMNTQWSHRACLFTSTVLILRLLNFILYAYCK